MASLQTDFLGMRFPNPFLLASAPPTRNGEMIRRAFHAGWGGAVTKTIPLKPNPDVTPRLHPQKQFHRNIGMENIELISRMPVEEWQQELAEIKAEFPDRPLWASIMAGTQRTDWARLVELLQETGIDAFEVNISCPHGMPGKGMGAYIGQDPELTGKVVSWVKKASKLPVIVKLTPNVTDIAHIALVAKENGADGFAAINTVSVLSGVNLDTLEPLPSVDGISAFGGYSGPAIKPIALRCLAQIVKATGLPVSGLGGISTWEDAAEFMSLGAGTVQVGTAVMWHGYRLIGDLTTGLSGYLDRMGFPGLPSIQGKALEKIVEFAELPVAHRMIAAVNQSCTGCLLCVTACRDGGYQAIEGKPGEIVKIDPAQCDGCGLCVMVCPENSLKMIPFMHNSTP